MWIYLLVESTESLGGCGFLFGLFARRGAACWIGVSATRADREKLEIADASSLCCIGLTPNPELGAKAVSPLILPLYTY